MSRFFCLLFILFGIVSGFGQEKITDVEKEFEATYKDSFKFWNGKPFRTIITTFSGTEGRPETDYTSKLTMEYDSIATSRIILENTFKTQSRRTERIRIGEKHYSREGNGEWKEEIYQRAEPGANRKVNNIQKFNEKSEVKFLGTEKLDGKMAKVFVKIEKSSILDLANNQEKSSDVEIKYWFALDGAILKKESNSKSITGEKTFFIRMTQTWEVDPNIKIEAPKEFAK